MKPTSFPSLPPSPHSHTHTYSHTHTLTHTHTPFLRSHACDEGASLVDSLKRAIQRDFKSMTTGVSSMERVRACLPACLAAPHHLQLYNTHSPAHSLTHSHRHCQPTWTEEAQRRTEPIHEAVDGLPHSIPHSTSHVSTIT